MDKLLYYLWKGIFFMGGIIVLYYIGSNLVDWYKSLTHFSADDCVPLFLILILIGSLTTLGYILNKLIEIFNPK